MGNRVSSSRDGVITNYVHDAANRLVKIGDDELRYDSNGNLTSKGLRSYTWDVLNRLIQVDKVGAGRLASYTYDMKNRRIRKILGSGEEVNYVYAGLNLMAEISGGGGEVTKLYNPGVSFTDTIGGNTFYYLHDGSGNVSNLVDEEGNLIDSNSYAAFGADGGLANNLNSFRFAGKYGVFSDDEVGLKYMWNRWYDPELGRFISSDPIRVAGGLNLYDYAMNNPFSNIDPFGLKSKPTAAGGLKKMATGGLAMAGSGALTLYSGGTFTALGSAWGFALGAFTFGSGFGDLANSLGFGNGSNTAFGSIGSYVDQTIGGSWGPSIGVNVDLATSAATFTSALGGNVFSQAELALNVATNDIAGLSNVGSNMGPNKGNGGKNPPCK